MNLHILTASFSFIYGVLTYKRNLAYDLGLFSTHKADATVISVGNLTTGGSGKTPFTVYLARLLQNKYPDLKTAIVSRGYRRKSKGVKIVADYSRVLLNPVEGGDEPVMMAKQLPGTPVVVAERRIEGARRAVEEFGTNIILLDDAFQHRQIQRDLDILLFDETQPSGSWHLLPWGNLRELPSGIRRAHCAVLTGGAGKPRQEKVSGWINKYKQGIPIYAGKQVADSIIDVSTGHTLNLSEIRGKKVAAVCGIAKPGKFYKTIEESGAEIVFRESWPDHFYPGNETIASLVERVDSSGAEVLLITAKDEVKMLSVSGFKVPVWSLVTKWQWTQGGTEFERRLTELLETQFQI